MNPVLDRLLAEELTRKRRSDDLYRHVEVFRRAAVDANPHQLEAALFALGRMDEGGALLCDEVGLGKTIEAGIVLTQLRLSGRPHQLILVPLSLAAQWQAELSDLFSLPVTVLGADNLQQATERGVYVIGRELATSPRWVPELKRLGPWDLVVIDEAHEVFSNLHQRFGAKTGAYSSDPTKGSARRAAALLDLLGDSPALVLTATPLQNNLYELWSLVHYVDRRGRVLGTLPEFGLLFARADGRSISEGMEDMLRQRLQSVVQRTLRRQAQPFMERPFTKRRCLTVNFHMDAVTRALHEALDAWLAGEIHAYPGSQRHLLRLMLRRRMGSSPHALASTLKNVRDRIERMIRNPFLKDPMTLDEDLQIPGEEPLEEPEYRVRLAGLKADFQHVERLEALAREVATATFGKAVALEPLITEIVEGRREGVAPKVVVFTESVRTLEALGEFLRSRGLQVSLLSGASEVPQQTIDRWQDEVGRFQPPHEHPGPSALARHALVYEFRTRTQVLLSTEAGAKGLNLQFANCLINFDLPWNPQRVEQRIGRVHRYGQERDVLIINCVNLDNLAEARVYEILHDKLQLFDGLFGASDDILGAVSAALDLERRVNAILDEFHEPAERGEAFDRLALEIDSTDRNSRDERLARARSLLAKLDAAVAARFRTLAEEMPAAMSRRDELLTRLVDATVVQTEGPRTLLDVAGKRYHLGPPSPSPEWGEPLSVDHPLVRDRVARVQDDTDGRAFLCTGPEPGAWEVYRVHLQGLEEEEVLLPLGEGDLQEALAEATLQSEEPLRTPAPEGLAEAVEALRLEAEARQRVHLDRRVRALGYRRDLQERTFALERADLETRLQAAERRRRGATSLKEQREAGAEVNRVKTRLGELTGEHEEARRTREEEAAVEMERLHRQAFVQARARRLLRVEIREG